MNFKIGDKIIVLDCEYARKFNIVGKKGVILSKPTRSWWAIKIHGSSGDKRLGDEEMVHDKESIVKDILAEVDAL